MHKTTVLAVLAAFVLGLSTAEAAPKKKTKRAQPATQTQPTKPPANTYGAGCKNQGASIMSGTCVN